MAVVGVPDGRPIEYNGARGLGADVVLAPGEECGFSVVFQPQAAGEHAASLPLTYSYPDDQGTVQGAASIALVGSGLESGLLLAPSVDICFQDVLGGGCTAGTDLVVSNVGTADETIDCIGFDLVPNDTQCPGLVAAAGFEVRVLSGTAVPLTLTPGAQETLQLRWCGDAADEAQGTFHVRPADAARPDLILGVERLVACP